MKQDQTIPCRPANQAFTPTHHTSKTAVPYALRKELGFWDLTFEGRSGIFKHEQGAFYVAYLLGRPWAEPIHGLVLALEFKERRRHTGGIFEIADPNSGRLVCVAKTATLQQRSLGLDDVEAARALRRKQQQLEALLEDEDQIEPVKAEAQRELEVIYQFQQLNAPRIRTSAEKAADAVGKAIKRLYQHLADATEARGEPHAVLRAFAEHLKRYLLIPSGRCGTPGGPRLREQGRGCFTYEPPSGITWKV